MLMSNNVDHEKFANVESAAIVEKGFYLAIFCLNTGITQVYDYAREFC